MGALWDKLDAKTLAVVITSSGGIVLAGYLAYSVLKLSTNDIQHLEAAIGTHNEETKGAQKETNQVIREVTKALEQNAGAIQQNTKAMEQLNQNLFLKR
mgnify:CR=1 FL=1